MEGAHVAYIHVVGRTTLKWIFTKWQDWIDMASIRDRLRLLVDAVMKILVPKYVGIFLNS